MSDTPSLSDHRIIQFHIKDELPVELLRNIRNINWERYKDSLVTGVVDFQALDSNRSIEVLDDQASKLTSLVIDSFHEACL